MANLRDKILNIFVTLSIVVMVLATISISVLGIIALYRLLNIVWVLSFVVVVETLAIGILAFYLKKFATIIMICEDDYGATIDTLLKTEKSIEKILSLELFFDSIEIKRSVENILDEVRANRIEIIQAAERFVEKSQQKYEIVDEGEIPNGMPMPEEIFITPKPPINPKGQHIIYRNYGNHVGGDF